MKNSRRLPFPMRAAASAALILTLCGVSVHFLRAAEKPPAAVAPPAIARELQGKWVHIGEPGKVGDAPKGGFIKLRTTGHWAAIAIDPRTGLVGSTHGGTWRVNGNEYEETVDYGGDHHAQIINQTWKWRVEIKGDTMIKKGINNEWHEVWKRVK